MFDLGDLSLRLLKPVDPGHLFQVPGSAVFKMTDPQLHLPRSEIAVPVVDRLEFAAINRHACTCQNANLAAQLDKPGTGLADRRAVVLSEVGDCLVIGRQPAGQPHHFDIAASFPFQSTAGWNPVEVSVDEELQ